MDAKLGGLAPPKVTYYILKIREKWLTKKHDWIRHNERNNTPKAISITKKVKRKRRRKRGKIQASYRPSGTQLQDKTVSKVNN